MSDLDSLIRPEIVNDELYHAIRLIAGEPWVENMLEIGSSSGLGSTQAFLEGMKNNLSMLYCLEMSKVRFNELVKNVGGHERVRCLNASTISHKQFPHEEDVVWFYRNVPSNLNNYSLEKVLEWLRQDRGYVEGHGWKLGPTDWGLEYIKREFRIREFDVVLIDGSEFTGYTEYKILDGAGVFILDDICSYKNYFTYQDLVKHPSYRLELEDKKLRAGFAVFRRVE